MRHATALLGLIAIAGAPAATPSAAGTRAPCYPPRSRTIVQTARARAYALRARPSGSGSSSWVAYACLFRVGRPVRLGERTYDITTYFRRSYVSHVRLAETYVAFNNQHADHYGTGDNTVKSLDLRTGKLVHDWIGGYDGFSDTVYGPVLDAHGAIAWIVQRSNESNVSSYAVWKADRPRAPRAGDLLDSGADIDPRSLDLHGYVLSWRHGQTRRTATIR